MTIEQTVIKKLRALPAEKQKTVLSFIESLQKSARKKPRSPLKGQWADLKISLSEKDIADARREMWKNFPRKIK